MNPVEKIRDLGIDPQDGQHFLRSELAVEKFIDCIDKTGNVLEIGGGIGAITQKLDDPLVLERDPQLASELRSQGFKVRTEDFLKADIPDDVDILVGNLPFQITSEILDKSGRLQKRCVFIVQEELADRLTRKPEEKGYDFYSFRMNYFFLPVKADVISSRSFYPSPEVDTAVLKLFPAEDRHDIEDREQFLDFSKALFTHARKKVRNAVVDCRHMLNVEKDEAKSFRDELPYSEKRVRNLEIKEMEEIRQAFTQRS
jgi:16S rRNA (adenine1518-N6/adenine1519-N6)-dimethyltransferase